MKPSPDYLRAAFDSCRESVYVTELKPATTGAGMTFRIVDVNALASQLGPVSVDEQLARELASAGFGSASDQIEMLARAAWTAGSEQRCEVIAAREPAAGVAKVVRHFECRVCPWQLGVIVYLHDATDEVAARSELLEQASLFDMSPDILAVADHHGRIRRVNPAFERLTGRTQKDLASAEAYSPLLPEDQAYAAETMVRLLAEGEAHNVELRFLNREGAMRTVSWTSRVGAGSEPLIFSVGRDVTDDRAAAEERRTLALVAKHAGDGILLFDASGRVRWHNPAATTVLDRSESELTGLDGPLLFGSDRLFARSAGEPKASEEIHHQTAGGPKWLGVELNRLPIPVGQTHFVAVVRDITARKQAELELRASEARFRTIADAAPVMIWTTDHDGRCVEVNRTVLEFKGRSREAELGDGWLVGVDPRDRADVEAEFARAVAERGEYAMEYRLRRADGETRWVADRGIPRVLQDGTFLGLVGVTTDITERREAVTREWAASFDAVDSMMVITSEEGTIERLNRAARAELGADAVGRRFRDVASNEPWITAARLIRTANFPAEKLTTESYGPGGRAWTVEVSAVADASRLVVLARDVSAVVALRDELAAQERLAAMGQLVAGVAHEVRNPLFALSAGIDAREVELPAELSEFTQLFRREIDRLSRLMADLLDFGRSHSFAPRLQGILPELVQGAIEQCRPLLHERKVVCEVVTPGPLPRIAVDAPRIEMLLRNLIDNAARFSPPGSAIEAVLTSLPMGPEGELVEVRVDDRGPGFGAHDLPSLGQPFFSRRKGGTGLGLAIASRVAADHGGTLRFENRPEGGGRVRLLLPVGPEASTQVGSVAPGDDGHAPSV